MASPPLVLSTEGLTIKRAKTDSLFSRGSIPGKTRHPGGTGCCQYLLWKKPTFTSPVPIVWESSSLEQPLRFPSVALVRQHQWYRKQFFQKPLFVHTRNHQAWVLSPSSLGWMCFPYSPLFFSGIFPKAQSNSAAYGNEIWLCTSSSSSSSSSWMELAESSCSDSVLVSKSCSSRKKLPMPYSASYALISAAEMCGDPRTKPANLPDF